MRLAWMPQYSHKANGYGFIAGRMAKALRDAGVYLIGREERDWDARIIVGLPTHSSLGREGFVEDAIYHTMFEATPMPAYYAGILNRCGGVWVPSQWCADLFREGGVTAPILVSGYGVDKELYEPKERNWLADRPLRIGVWAHSWVDRKNAVMATRAYIDAGLKGATLQVKITAAFDADHVEVEGQQRHDITVMRGEWQPYRLAAWLQGLDVLIYLSGGEGFGLQPLEAMSTGCVVMVAGNTGMMEYATQENAVLIDCPGRVKSSSYRAMYGEQDFWLAVPDHDAVVEGLRWCHANRAALARKSEAGMATATSWSWERAGVRIRDLLSQHLHKV